MSKYNLYLLTLAEKIFNISREIILSKRRDTYVLGIRGILYKILRDKGGAKLLQISQLYDKNYATIINGLRRINGDLQYSQGYEAHKYFYNVAKNIHEYGEAKQYKDYHLNKMNSMVNKINKYKKYLENNKKIVKLELTEKGLILKHILE